MEEKDIMQDVSLRLANFKAKTGLSLNAFAGKIGMKHATLHNQFHGKRDLSLETVLNTLAAFNELSAEWLLRGKGEMFESLPIVTLETTEQNTDARLEALVDTITLLQDTIKAKNATIDALHAELAQYKRKSQKA